MGLFLVPSRSFRNMGLPWNPCSHSALLLELISAAPSFLHLLVCSMDSAVSPPFTLLFSNAFGPSYLPSGGSN